MPQTPVIPDGMTVRDLVALGRYPWHGPFGRLSPEDRRRVDAALSETGLARLAPRPVSGLSGGERQRAWLALMLAQGADWLLLDEPSSALDLAWSLDLLTRLRAQAQSRGTGVLVALHDLNLAARFCDDLLALREGELVAHGTTDEVLRPEILARTFGVPMRVIRDGSDLILIAQAEQK